MTKVTDDMIERLKDAVEGECEGLAISDDQARTILKYAVLGEEPKPDPRQVQMAVAIGRVVSYADARLAARNGSRETMGADEDRVGKAMRSVEQYLTVLIQDAVDLQEIRNFAKKQNDWMSTNEQVPTAQDWNNLYSQVIR